MIGIIGGNGVAATNKLLTIIEEKTTKSGAFRDGHHLEIIAWQATKAPSRSMYLEGKGESFIPDYIDIGKKLKLCGVTKLCMCCNTAHFALKELEESIGIPFISIIKEVVLDVADKKHLNIGILASDGNVKYDLYGKEFEKYYPHANVIYPDEYYQKILTKGICNIKNINRFNEDSNPDKPSNIFNTVINHLISKNCDCIILGCTDISVDFNLYEYANSNITVIDSLELLAKKIIENYKEV